MKKTITLFFGEMGSGKSYLGQRYANLEHMTFIEGDFFLSEDMRERVEAFQYVSPDQIDELVDRLRYDIPRLAAESLNGVVVSQALYRDADRWKLIHAWQKAGFEVDLFWVKPGVRQNLKQLLSREKGWRWVAYWLMSKPFFERPTHKAYIP